MDWNIILGFVTVITTALTSVATWNIRTTAGVLKETTQTLQRIQVDMARMDERIKILEKEV